MLPSLTCAEELDWFAVELPGNNHYNVASRIVMTLDFSWRCDVNKFGGLFLLAMILVACSSGKLLAQRGGPELEHTKDSLEKVKELVAQNKAVLVDVRELVEWDAGHVKGAVFLPWRDLQDKFDEAKLREKLPKDTIIYTYCAVGYRSLRAGKIIAKYQYEVRPLKPGYEELVKAGFEGEKK
jgi:phage shock protein E